VNQAVVASDVNGKTQFQLHSQFLADENARPLLVPIIQATYNIGRDGQLTKAEEQSPVNCGGECWGKPGESSYKYEPQVAFTKPSTDVVLIGSAYAQETGSRQVDVGLYMGPLGKVVRVVGDRYWIKTLGMALISSPEPFDSIPLLYERAFGGWDRSNPDSEAHTFEARNPVGTGFRSKSGRFEEGTRLPNLEDPRHPIRSHGDTPPPAGFGFTAPNWQPRVTFAGTYDDEWMRERMPLLPMDFDPRFFNAASSGLVTPTYLNGDEPVMIENVSPDGRITFNLPGLPPPVCRVELKGAADLHLETKLDTVIINTDEKLLFLIWRAHTLLKNGPHDVVTVEVEGEGHPNSVAVG
jgi:hypothetical protein